jgi:hypothetical protein
MRRVAGDAAGDRAGTTRRYAVRHDDAARDDEHATATMGRFRTRSRSASGMPRPAAGSRAASSPAICRCRVRWRLRDDAHGPGRLHAMMLFEPIE